MKRISQVLLMSLCLIGLSMINPQYSKSDSYVPIKFFSNYDTSMRFQGESFINDPYKYQKPNDVIVISTYVPVSNFIFIR